MKTISLFVPLFATVYVSAHGFLRTVTIGGQAYTGNVPAGAKNPSIIQQVSTPFPNHGATNPALTCGPNSTAGSLVADANPGDTVTFGWKGADLSNWPHNTGPMLTYLANCGSTSCDQFDITTAKWFKIHQVGKKADNNATWVQADLTTGGVATVTLPHNLAAGNYIARHEIIALHLGNSLLGAEFYPACAQIKVGGTQTGAPDPKELVSLPGAYSDNDPGIFDKDVFEPNAPYTFPGPAIASFVGDTTGTGTGTGTSTSGNSTTTPTSSSTPPAQSSKASSKSCRVKKRTTTSAAVVRPRHFSRIMRRFASIGDSHHH